MARIDVCELEPGMVLASDLRDRDGRCLLSKGVKLTLKHLRIIKMWGVVEADVEGMSEKDIETKKTAHIAPEILEAADSLTRKRFIHTDLEHEAIRQLLHICVLRKANEITNAGDPAGTGDRCSAPAHSDHNSGTENSEAKIDPIKLIRNKIKLPSLPVIFSQINEAISDPKSSATQVANIINKDSSLSARLLKIVNSALYGFPCRIDTISRAVAIIGTKQLSILALGTSALTVFKDIPSDLLDMRLFWKHSIACGIIARIIASYKNDKMTERFFLAGLLHDIGRLIMLKYLPFQAKEALLKAKRTDSPLCKTEEEVTGFNHAVMGSILVKEWKLPATLENAIKYHHRGSECKISLESAVVHLSDIITNALGIGASGEQFVPPLNTKAWEEIGMSTGVLAATVREAEPHIAQTVHIFFPDE